MSVEADLLEELDKVLLSDWLHKTEFEYIIIVAIFSIGYRISGTLPTQASKGQRFKAYDMGE